MLIWSASIGPPALACSGCDTWFALVAPLALLVIWNVTPLLGDFGWRSILLLFYYLASGKITALWHHDTCSSLLETRERFTCWTRVPFLWLKKKGERGKGPLVLGWNNTPLIFYRLSEDIPLQHNLLLQCSFYPPCSWVVLTALIAALSSSG